MAPSAEGVVPSPPPVGTASAQSEMPESLAPPPSVPHSLADTLPFVVDLENHDVSPHAHPPLTGDVQPPPLASPPPSPSFSVARPCLLHPSSPSVRSAVARSPGPSPGTSSASWSIVPPVSSPGSVSASVFAPRSRWQDGTLSASYRPRGFGSMLAHIAVPPPPPPSSFRPAPRVDMPASAPPAYKKFKPVPVISVASRPASVSLPLPPAPLELKLTASATQSMYLASGRSSESSASQTDQQYSALLVRWREFLSELGAASALYSEACASQNRDFLLDRAAMKFAPSTLLRYFDAWLNWSSFCRLADASPHDPPPGLLPDWLKSQSSRQGLATMQLRALAWFVKTAGLPKLKVCLCTPICQAFAVASNPTGTPEKSASESELRHAPGKSPFWTRCPPPRRFFGLVTSFSVSGAPCAGGMHFGARPLVCITSRSRMRLWASASVPRRPNAACLLGSLQPGCLAPRRSVGHFASLASCVSLWPTRSRLIPIATWIFCRQPSLARSRAPSYPHP